MNALRFFGTYAAICSSFLVVAYACYGANAERSEGADHGVTALDQAEVVEIPLDEVWGYNLPGTRDIAGISFPPQTRTVVQNYAYLNRERDYNIEQIRRVLASKPPGEKALPGFVLPGRPDSRMLLGIHPPLGRKSSPTRKPLREGEYTLVFFSHPLSYFTRLKTIERNGGKVTVYYQFEPHATPEATVHFALIPLGELTPGEYQVDYRQVPMDQKNLEMGFEPVHPEAAEIVCRDFSFTISDDSAVEPMEGAVIPLQDIWAYNMPGTRDIRKLDEVETDHGVSHPLIKSLIDAISKRYKQDKQADSAFVVEGTGRTALENMVAAFEDDEPPRYVPDHSENSLVFYSLLSSRYVHVEAVERKERKFVVTYQFVRHPTRVLTCNFALIPLGKLSAGTYEVEVRPSAAEREELAQRVCQSTNFYVEGRGP
jgi:hypothetical protein